jgi:hypothetical protein
MLSALSPGASGQNLYEIHPRLIGLHCPCALHEPKPSSLLTPRRPRFRAVTHDLGRPGHQDSTLVFVV